MPVSLRRKAEQVIEDALDKLDRLSPEVTTETERRRLDHLRTTLFRLIEDRTRPNPFRMESSRRVAIADHFRDETKRPPR
jgi:hypothetical protein